MGVMMFFSSVLPASAAGLTWTQINAIVGLLLTFGADQSVIDSVQANLHGCAPGQVWVKEQCTGKIISTALIKVTAPNGGEQWQEGVMNSVTWTPYEPDANPSVNNSHDVTAYLEQEDSQGHFVTLGNIEESGKASIHWRTGELNSYVQSGNFVKPGSNYYIRVVNNKTGASDRSDAAFTLILPPVSMKVNGSHGPLTLGDNAQVTVSWTSTGTTGCTIYALRQHLGDTVVPEINNLPTSGYQTGYTIVDSSYGGYISVSCHTSNGTTYSDFVSINPASSAPKLSILSPNGGEQIPTDKPFNIKWTQRGLSTVSIALYKNDKWYAWIDKDVSSDQSADDTYSYPWSSQIGGLADTSGNVFKIYITGQQADGTGYLDDKSNAPFGFSVPVATPSAALDRDPFAMSTGSVTVTGVAKGVKSIYLAFLTDPGLNLGPTAVVPGVGYGTVDTSGHWSLDLSKVYMFSLPVGTYTVSILSGDQATFGQKLGQGTLTMSNTPQSSASLQISTDSSSAGYTIVTAGSTGVELGRIRFTATNEAIDLRQLALRITSGSPNDLAGRQVTLWDGVTKIGTAVFPTSVTATSSAITSGAFRIPMNSSRTLIIKGDLATIGQSGPITASGDLLQVNFDSSNVTRTYGTFGVGVSSASNIQPTGNTNVAGVRIFKSYPTVALMPADSKLLFNGSGQRLIRFKIAADTKGDIATAVLKFAVNAAGVSLSNYALYAYTDASYSNVAPGGVGADGLVDVGVVEGTSVGIYQIFEVPAGGARYFELRATASGVSSNSTVSTNLLGDSYYIDVASYSDQKGKSSNFVWSPNTLTWSQETTVDWANGYAISDLSAKGVTQILTGSGSPAPNPTPTLTVTSPTSATAVGSGQKMTISWKADNAPAGSVGMM